MQFGVLPFEQFPNSRTVLFPTFTVYLIANTYIFFLILLRRPPRIEFGDTPPILMAYP